MTILKHKILWFSWKDWLHPQSGGAEIVSREIAQRLVKDGHEVIFFTAGYPGAKSEEKRLGYKIIRRGCRYTVYLHALWYYWRHLRHWPTLVIDEMNTLPFFTKFYISQSNFILSYQLCREIWFHQMLFPFSLIGYLIEPFYLYLVSDQLVLTESESTRQDMGKYGFDKKRIGVFPVGLEHQPLSSLAGLKKYSRPTLLYVGSLRSMKRPRDVIAAFNLAKESIPQLQLKIAGGADQRTERNFTRLIAQSPYAQDIEYRGRVTQTQKIRLMRQSHLIAVTSVKEGWGLIVTEANSQGTPAVVYDVDGLRDACKHQRTGLVVPASPSELATGVIKLLQNKDLYRKYQRNAWRDSFNYNYDQTYQVFTKHIKRFIKINLTNHEKNRSHHRHSRSGRTISSQTAAGKGLSGLRSDSALHQS